MAMSCSLVVPVLLLISITPVVHSARAPAPAPADNVQTACNKTTYPLVCLKTLSANPEGQTASVRRLAELCLQASSKMTAEAAAFAKPKMVAVKEPSLCLKDCVFDIDMASTKLATLPADITDAKFEEMKLYLAESLLALPSKCGLFCPDKPSPDEIAVRDKATDLWNLLTVTSELTLQASPIPEDDDSEDSEEAESPSAEPPSA